MTNNRKVDELMDREKVIKGLYYCTKLYLGCKECPYFGESDSKASCECKLKTDAYNLLKEQEAVEPRVSTAEQRCGHCNKVIEMDGWQSCPWCGKRIDWESWWSKNGTRN